ncbi:MAG: SRPBCC family protein, partial [Anaerolineales bacterium]
MAAKTAKTQTLKFKRLVNAPPSEVYRAFTHATALRDWLSNAAETDPTPGGRLYLWWANGYYANGEFTALEPGKKVAFTWHGKGEPAPTRIQVSLAAKNGSTQVTLAHSGIGRGKQWAQTAAEFAREWEAGL